MKPRDYQADLIDQIDHARRRQQHCLVVAPTGAGKTVVVGVSAARTSESVLFVAPWRQLIDQTAAAFERCGVHPGRHMAGRESDPSARVQVASLDTLANRPLRRFDRIYVDEAHRADTKPRRALLQRHLAAGGTVIGLTATPWTDRGTVKGYNVAAVGPSPAELAERGLLRRPRFYLEEHRQTLARLDRDARAVLFSESVAASKRQAAELRAAGFAAEHIDGTTKGKPRRGVFERFERGDLQAITNCAVLTEGFDSTIDVVGLRRRGMNLRLYVQAIGRGIRPNGDREAAVSDPGGLCRNYGSPLDLPWPLYRAGDRPKPERRKLCRDCLELAPPGPHECRREYKPPRQWIDLVARETGLGAVWEAEEWARRGRPWFAGRDLVIRELEAEASAAGLGPGWVRARLIVLGLA